MAKSKREAIAYTNEIDQVINPGDSVIVVTHCTGSTYTRKGTYLGMSGRKVQAEVPCPYWRWVYRATGEECEPGFRQKEENRNPFRWGTPEWNEKNNDINSRIQYKRFYGTRVTTLNHNRIYKLA